MIIRPYIRGSASARALAKALGAKLRLAPTHGLVLNWGNPREIDPNVKVINKPRAVEVAGNKLLSFRVWGEDGCVPWTTDFAVAQRWLSGGDKVVGRTLLRGHSGHGITVFIPNKEPGLVQCPLYTKYIVKKKEYRVHVFLGEVIDVCEKRRRDGAESSLIRSHENGYVFCREGVTISEPLRQLALSGIARLGLDFGAVDIIWNEKSNKYYLLEINTAPGLEGTTLERYADACRKHLNG